MTRHWMSPSRSTRGARRSLIGCATSAPRIHPKAPPKLGDSGTRLCRRPGSSYWRSAPISSHLSSLICQDVYWRHQRGRPPSSRSTRCRCATNTQGCSNHDQAANLRAHRIGTPDRRRGRREARSRSRDRLRPRELIARHNKRGRPTIGDAPSSVESVRLDPELRRQLLERAEADGTTPSELIREALRRYLDAA
jgi:hypothetical protein